MRIKLLLRKMREIIISIKEMKIISVEIIYIGDCFLLNRTKVKLVLREELITELWDAETWIFSKKIRMIIISGQFNIQMWYTQKKGLVINKTFSSWWKNMVIQTSPLKWLFKGKKSLILFIKLNQLYKLQDKGNLIKLMIILSVILRLSI